MSRLEISNVIDILGKDCKNDKHKQCNGNWIGLGFRVDCNCSCHQNKNTSDDKRDKTVGIFGISNVSENKITKGSLQSNAEYKWKDLREINFRVDKSFRGSSQHDSIVQGED